MLSNSEMIWSLRKSSSVTRVVAGRQLVCSSQHLPGLRLESYSPFPSDFPAISTCSQFRTWSESVWDQVQELGNVTEKIGIQKAHRINNEFDFALYGAPRT